jgi:hypothetical protein
LSMPKPSWIRLTPSQQRELDSIVPTPGRRLVPKENIPSVFPVSFREKMDSAVMISAPTSTGGTFLVFNAIRLDAKAMAFDQEPFAIIVHTTGSDSEGLFLHHGSWEGRTEHPSTAFWDELSKSNVGNYFLSAPPSGMKSGSLEQLPVGHRKAFAEITEWIRREHST